MKTGSEIELDYFFMHLSVHISYMLGSSQKQAGGDEKWGNRSHHITDF